MPELSSSKILKASMNCLTADYLFLAPERLEAVSDFLQEDDQLDTHLFDVAFELHVSHDDLF